MSDKSAKPILVAGAVGTVALLGVAWMFAASAGEQARLNAIEYAESKSAEAVETAAVEVEAAEVEPAEAEVAAVEVEEPAEAEVAAVEAEEPAEAEVAAVEAEEPAEAEVAAVEVEEPAEAEVTAVEVEEPAEAEVAAVEAEEPAEVEVAAVEAEEPAEAEVAAVEAEEPAEPQVAEVVAAAPAAAAVELASIDGDAKAGAKVFRKCKACHKIGDGAKNAVGPHLTDVVGRVQGSVESYTKYSDGFKAAMAEGKKWTPAELDAFLTKPKDYMPGTKMAFGGLRKEDDRANVIAYLATNGE